MNCITSSALTSYAVGVLLLGVVGVVFGDYALQWQPMPDVLRGNAYLENLSASLLILAGAAMFIAPIAARAALATALLFLLWTLGLHAPQILADPSAVIYWNGFAELAAITAGGVMGWALLTQNDRIAQGARRCFGACFAVFGVAHFAYVDFTAGMVPEWMPARLFWAYATGVGHLAASVSLLFNRGALLASSLLTAMLASFVVLVHIPGVIARPAAHIEWVMLAIATALAGAAWTARASITHEASGAQKHRAELSRSRAPARSA